MPKPIHEMSSWGASAHSPRVLEEDEEWEATRQVGGATQVMRDRDEELATISRNVGRQISASQWEMFVVCEPGDAMQQQFEMLHPEYIALHDIGTSTSRRLLAGLAAAANRPVHKLHIRRQGHGVALATLEFVEMPVAEGAPPLRLYTTETDADTQSRRRLARVLLAFSRLAVVMVGDLPPHALATALLPLREAVTEGPWPNRELLMLPLASAAALASQAARLAVGTEVAVRTTPQVTRPGEAWAYMRGSWTKLRNALRESTAVDLPEIVDPVPATNVSLPGGSAAPTAPPAAAAPVQRLPLPLQPMPAVPKAAATPVIADAALAAYVRQCGQLKGMLSCCVFELATQRTLGHAGGRPGPAALSSQGATLMASMAEGGQALGLGAAAPDAAISFGAHHLLLRALPGRPGLALHAVLDRTSANLTLVRLQLQRLDALLDAAPA